MKATNAPYNISDLSESVDRMKAILDASDGAFEEKDSIPPAESLTYDNGFYVKCSALFIDIRGSSTLPDKHTRPVLAKIYRSYISEAVAVMNSNPNCREVVIKGDCVSAILDTPYTTGINTAFESAAKLNSLVNVLNWQLEKKSYTPIRCGIGLAWGRALMLKAGFKGSGINDIVWMGDVVNEASKLCGRGNKLSNAAVQVSADARHNLNDQYKTFLTAKYDTELNEYRYEGNVIETNMEKWLEEQKEKERRNQALAQALARTGLFGGLPAPRRPLGLLARNMHVPPVTPFSPQSGSTSLRSIAGLGTRPFLLSGAARDPFPSAPKDGMWEAWSALSASGYLPKR